MNKSINEIQEEIIEEFSGFDDWMDKYSLIIDYGNELEPLSDNEMVDSNLIDGCQAKVWIVIYEHVIDGNMKKNEDNVVLEFKGYSDAILVRGIVALLLRVLSNHSPREIVESNLYFLESIQLKEHLSSSRTNGLNAMLRKIRQTALTYFSIGK